MEVYKDLQFEVFTNDDLEEMTMIMKNAFDEDSKRHLDEPSGGPEGYDNGDFLRKWALNPGSIAMKIIKNNKIVGLFIVWINENDENFLGNLFINSDMQDKGLGLTTWEFIEHKFPQTKIWRTETPGFSKRNHHFYVNKCGFSIVKIENPGKGKDENYIMEKRIIKK